MIDQIEEETGALPPHLTRGVSPETAAANPDVEAIIAPRLTMLMEIANSFLLTIIESKDSVPYGIRWICKQIRSLTRVSGHARCEDTLHHNGFFPHRGSTPKQQTMRYALSLVDSSSCGSSTPQSSRRKRTCLWTVYLPNIPVGP